MTDKGTSGQSVQKSPELPEGLFLQDGIEGLRSLPRHSVDMLLTDPPYGTTRNFWDVPGVFLFCLLSCPFSIAVKCYILLQR